MCETFFWELNSFNKDLKWILESMIVLLTFKLYVPTLNDISLLLFSLNLTNHTIISCICI